MNSWKAITLFSVMMLVCMSLVNCSCTAVEKTERIESNGFKWYELKQDGFCGAKDGDGKTLIPVSRNYDFICYVTTNGGWFLVEKAGKAGACDNDGNEMISPTKYESLSYRNEAGKEFFYAVLNGKTGICNKRGEEFYYCTWDNNGIYPQE